MSRPYVEKRIIRGVHKGWKVLGGGFRVSYFVTRDAAENEVKRRIADNERIKKAKRK